MDADYTPWPVAAKLNTLFTLATEFARAEYAIALARELSSEGVVRALAYGAAHARGEAEGEAYVEGGWEEASVVANLALPARVALDSLWPTFEGDDWGHLGDAIVSADAVAEASLDAFRFVAAGTWAALAFVDPVSMARGASWWGDLRAALRDEDARDLARWLDERDAIEAREDACV